MPLVFPGKQAAFEDIGFILEAEKFHGFSFLCAHYLAGDEPAHELEPAALLHGLIRKMEELLRG